MYIDQMANLSDIAPGFTPKNLQFMTYATAMAKARCGDEIPQCDVIVADEFHHCGAPEWGKGVQYVVENNPDAKIVGFSATPIRYSDKGRNMADEMFVGNIASSMELEEAWLDGVLPMPKYVIALYDAPKELGELKVSIEKVREKKKYSKFVKKYEELRRSLQDADGIDRIIAKHLRKRDGKVIVFCPNQKKLQEFMLLRREWFGRVNKEVHAYKTTSADPYGSRDFQEFKEDSSSALKVLYCINQLNEAVHVKGIDAIVMVRPTKSPVIFQQQLGRALTSGGNRTPLVFDLCNNFGSLGGIAGMQERMERSYEKKHWCYPDDLESRIDNAEEYTVPRKTAVQCLETGKMYESIADASRDTGINHNSIRSVARGDRHKAGGYTWEYVNPAPDKRDNRGCNQPTAKKVRCAETGNQFVSLSDAARAVGLRNGNSIRRAIGRGGTAGGYHWEYVDEKKEVSTDDHHQADGRAE